MLRVMRQVDKANGYVFGDLEERDIQSMMSCAVQAEFEYKKIKDVRENYIWTPKQGTLIWTTDGQNRVLKL